MALYLSRCLTPLFVIVSCEASDCQTRSALSSCIWLVVSLSGSDMVRTNSRDAETPRPAVTPITRTQHRH